MMDRTIVTFDTTHHALWAEELAKEAGIAHDVVPAPPGAHARCNIALEILTPDAEHLSEILEAAAVEFRLFTPGSG